MTDPGSTSPRLPDSGGAGLSVSERPVCRCHGEPMGWNTRPHRRGHWYCRIKRREYGRRINAARRVQFRVADRMVSVYVDNKEEVIAARDAFRAKQRQEYKEAKDGGFDTTVS